MNFTDTFIRRPVLAMVISLLLVVLGLRAAGSLPINQYPKTQNAVVTVTTAYFGADASTVAGFITQPLEAAIAQAQGIDPFGPVFGSIAALLVLGAFGFWWLPQPPTHPPAQR